MRGLFLRVCRALALSLLLAGLFVPRAVAQSAPLAAVGTAFDRTIADAEAMMLADPAKAVIKARQAERLATRLVGRDRSIALATAEWLQGEGFLRLNDTAGAAPLIERAIATVRMAGPPTKLSGDLLLSQGGVRTARADVAGALSSYQAAHNIFQKIGETRSQAIALVSIAQLYTEAKDYNNALKYYDQAIEVYNGDPQLLFVVHESRGVALKEVSRFADAQADFNKAIGYAKLLKSPSLEAETLRNMARVQLQGGQLDAADRTIAQGFQASRGEEAGFARNHFLVLSAQSALLHGRLSDAIRLITRSFGNVDLGTTTLDLREGHQTAYDIFKKAGNQVEALAHLEALKRLDDQTSTLAASANTSLAAARFDFANQELRIEKLKRAELQRNVDDARQRARTQQQVFIGIGVAAAVIVSMLVVGLITIRRSRNDVRAANIDLAATNAALGKALAVKTEFLATTSHEIRTPLNGILGMTQVMLADPELSDRLRDRIGVVHGAGVTMRALVDDILDVAKMETGNLTIERAAFDLKATLCDVSRMWEEQARGKGLAFTLDLDRCPGLIEGDAARLRQIAFNLLSNALKFTAYGSIRLVAGTRGAGGETVLTIAVSDSGIGIPADKLGLVFESFRQVDAGTTRKFGGTGLGLSICQKLARAMGGDVVVTSIIGEGSTFTLELPLVLAAAPEAAEVAAVTPGALLILDRNPISRSMLRAVLEARAGTVVFAATPDEAVERIAQGGVARVLIDDATIRASDDIDAALRSLAAKDAMTVLLWAAPGEADRARFAACGIDLVVAKPIAGAALAAAVFADADTRDTLANGHLVTRAA